MLQDRSLDAELGAGRQLRHIMNQTAATPGLTAWSSDTTSSHHHNTNELPTLLITFMTAAPGQSEESPLRDDSRGRVKTEISRHTSITSVHICLRIISRHMGTAPCYSSRCPIRGLTGRHGPLPLRSGAPFWLMGRGSCVTSGVWSDEPVSVAATSRRPERRAVDRWCWPSLPLHELSLSRRRAALWHGLERTWRSRRLASVA